MKRVILIIIFSLLIFSPSVGNFFFGDDWFHLSITQIHSIREFFNFFSFAQTAQSSPVYRPLSIQVFFSIFQSLFGVNALPYHLFSLSLFAAILFLVYNLAKKILHSESQALITLFLYGVSATNFSRLYYISMNQELLMMLFVLLSIFFYLKENSLKNTFLSCLFFVLAVLSKETAIVLPVILVALDFLSGKINLKKLFPFAILLLPYLYLRIFLLGVVSGGSYVWIISPKKIFNTLFWYALWSFGTPELLVDYVSSGLRVLPRFFTDFPQWSYIILISTVVGVGSFLALIVKNIKKIDTIALVSLAIFFIGLAPFVFLPWHKFTIELTLPLFGFAMFLARILQKEKIKALAGVGLVIFFVFNVLTLVVTYQTNYSVSRSKISQQIFNYFKIHYPKYQQGKYFEFVNDTKDYGKDWGSSKQIAQVTSNSDLFKVLYKDPLLKVFYEDISATRPANEIKIPISTQMFLAPSNTVKTGVNCDNRYVTLVNPVRGREYWIANSLKPLDDQYSAVSQAKMPATWLLTEDILNDKEVMQAIHHFNNQQELGVFLEVTPTLATGAKVIYPSQVPWFYPNAVFLSAYSQSDRRKLINKLLTDFKNNFGYYPKSVGAWWIDSYSLDYLKQKYGIKTAMIVADQLTTDRYGVWGQWWGVPYYPSHANVLTPASSLSDKEDVAVIQWAQRDGSLAYGESSKYSNYSLQANDYIRQGKDTSYFKDVAATYLDCKNPLGQITVGLETGIESVGYIDEYKNQLKALSQMPNLQPVTMSSFADDFAKIYPQFPQQAEVDSPDSVWKMTVSERDNNKFNEKIFYQPNLAFVDYFVADKSDFLNRNLTTLPVQKNTFWFPLFIPLTVLLGIISFLIKKKKIFVLSVLFSLAAFGLVFRSTYQYGWYVYFGPQVPFLMYVQPLLLLVVFGLFLLFDRLKINKRLRDNLMVLLPLSFGLDLLLTLPRFINLSGTDYLGVTTDALRLLGVSFSKPFSVRLINMDLSAVEAASLLKINFDKVWDNLALSLLAYPLVHIIITAILTVLLSRLPKRVRKAIFAVLVILYVGLVVSIFTSDPRLVSRN